MTRQFIWMRRGSMAALVFTLIGGAITTFSYIHGLESQQAQQAAKFAADRAVMQDKIEDLESGQRYHTQQMDGFYRLLIEQRCNH
ncbi:MAG: hypothetical protein KGL39_14060 [Patescibacteria group bacterium]|nr:hypothetical protein [Patescibacteria group bacterium]